jgi:hypothetical protein
MTPRRKYAAVFLLSLVVSTGILISSRPRWLKPHGRVSCGGQAVVGASAYVSQAGDVFVYSPSVDIQIAVVSPTDRQLGRCNPAFTPVFGYLFSREAEPSASCASMWKGGDSNDVQPPHIVTGTYAEFPWDHALC